MMQTEKNWTDWSARVVVIASHRDSHNLPCMYHTRVLAPPRQKISRRKVEKQLLLNFISVVALKFYIGRGGWM